MVDFDKVLYGDKQVFIAFDHIATYSEDLVKMLRDNTVTKITKGGNELYGKSCNKVELDWIISRNIN